MIKMGQKNRPFAPLIITGTNSFYYKKDIFSKDNWKYLIILLSLGAFIND